MVETIKEEPGLEIAGTASNGQMALIKISQLNPDIVTLDIHLPEASPFQTLIHLRKNHPSLPVIMLSSLDLDDAALFVDALDLGASEYATKPEEEDDWEEKKEYLRETLVPKIRALCLKPCYDPPPTKVSTKVSTKAPAKPPAQPKELRQIEFSPDTATPSAGENQVDIVAIGGSTGGPNAIMKVLKDIPADFPIPIVIVIHMPPFFTKQLALRLDSKIRLRVQEAASGDGLHVGQALVAPGDYHMELNRFAKTVQLNQNPPENSCRPSVDVLFQSVAEIYGPNALAVVLTGMGQDGMRGSQSIRKLGGQVLVQDEASSVVWGMPRAVAEAGLADEILPIGSLASEILSRVNTVRGDRVAADGKGLKRIAIKESL